MAATSKKALAPAPKPSILRRGVSEKAYMHMWERTMQRLFVAGATIGMPPYVDRLLATFNELHGTDARTALTRGDVVYFLAVELRLHRLDEAFVAAGRSVGDRARIIQAKAVCAGMRDVAIERLKLLGGSWP